MNIGASDIGKEDAAQMRIEQRRAANEARRGRFLNARTRTMGVNVAALDAQVAERKANMAAEAASEDLERYRFAEVQRVLEQVADEEKQLRKYQSKQLWSAWDQGVAEKAERDAIKDPAFDRNTSGMAAVQKFSGEDDSRFDRIRAQQQQLASWTNEQLEERALKREEVRKEALNNDEMMLEIDRLRGVAEDEEKALRKAMIQHSNKLNDEFSKLAAEQKALDQAQSYKDDALGCLPIVFEQKENALSNSGNVAAGKRDNFKGYTHGQVRRILSDNEELIRYKEEDAAQKERSERIWRLQQDIAQKEMEKAYMEEQLMRAASENARLGTIKEQMVAEEARREFSKKDAFGNAGHVFFNRFGTSCR